MPGPERVRAAVAITAAAVLVGACGGGSSVSTRSTATSTSTVTSNSNSNSNSTSASVSPPSVRSRASTSSPQSATAVGPSPPATRVPRFDHIVVVVEENKPFGDLVGTPATPFLTGLAGNGAVLTESYAIRHPSEPNYLALFSGSTQGLTSDSCPHRFTGPNLAGALIAAGYTFVGYSEGLPAPGDQSCSHGDYARKHAPWVNFDLPTAVNQPLSAFPTDLSTLPSVSFVIPDLQDDMHDGSVAKGDQWLATHLSRYRDWARTHNSLLLVTTDEDDTNHGNHITTIVSGAHVQPGRYGTRTDHYGILRTLLESFGLSPFAAAANAAPVTAIWTR